MENIKDTLSFLGQNIAIFALIGAVIYGLVKVSFEYLNIKSGNTRKEEYVNSFNQVVQQLSSSNTSAQLSAAILLRRFFYSRIIKKKPEMRYEVINVISSLLRTLPTGILQKTLGDGLAYAGDLTEADLQRTNMQDLYIGKKKKEGEKNIVMHKTDMYLADLSHSLLEFIDGEGVVFYHSILLNTRIKNSDFSNANFANADLTNVTFKNTILRNANFANARNIPDDIKEH